MITRVEPIGRSRTARLDAVPVIGASSMVIRPLCLTPSTQPLSGIVNRFTKRVAYKQRIRERMLKLNPLLIL